MVDALTLGDGPLSSGFQPGMLTANEAGQKALAEAIQADEAKVEKKKAPKGEKPEKREPKTLEEFQSQHAACGACRLEGLWKSSLQPNNAKLVHIQRIPVNHISLNLYLDMCVYIYICVCFSDINIQN